MSSSGKTLSQRLAVSVWSTTGLGAGLLQSLRTTENAVESIAQSASGTVLALDEVAHIDGRTLGRMVYSIAGGQGKARLSSEAVLRQRYSWTTFILLSGGSPQAARLEPNENGDIPVIRTEPSALQNIADTANRLVARMDEVLSEENVKRIANTLANIESMTGAVAAQREDVRALIVNARTASEQLSATLKTTNRTVEDVDRELVDKLPGLVAKLDGTLTRLGAAAGGASAVINENRAAIHSFANDGLGQLGPTLSELRALVRDLRRISDRLEGSPARYLLGRDAPKEFEPK